MSFREVPIGAAFDVRNGATPASGEERYWDGGIPWVTPADLGALQGREMLEGSRAITPEGFASCGTQMVPAGSIILSIRAPVGHMAIAKNPLCFNQGCRGLIPRRIIRSDFAYWALLARRPQLEAAAQGTTFVELGRGKLRAERVPVPDVETQKAIADFLDRETARIDQLTDKKQRMMDLLSEKEASLISEAITCDGQSTKLAHHTSILPGYAFPSADFSTNPDDVRLLRGANTGSGIIQWDDVVYWPKSQVFDFIRFSLGVADIVMGMDRPWISSGIRVARITAKDIPSLLLQRVCKIAPRPSLDAGYLMLLLKSNLFLAHFEPILTGISVPHISGDQIASFRFPYRPLGEQKEKVAHCEAAVEHGKAVYGRIAASIDRLREFRSALITAAVTGQLDVTTWGKQGTTGRRLEDIEAEMADASSPERERRGHERHA